MFDKNPYPRIVNSTYKKIDNIRKDIAFACQKIDRFKKEEPKLNVKIKKIQEIASNYYIKWASMMIEPEPKK